MAHAASQLKKKADENLNAAEEEKEKKRARKRSREVKKKVVGAWGDWGDRLGWRDGDKSAPSADCGCRRGGECGGWWCLSWCSSAYTQSQCRVQGGPTGNTGVGEKRGGCCVRAHMRHCGQNGFLSHGSRSIDSTWIIVHSRTASPKGASMRVRVCVCATCLCLNQTFSHSSVSLLIRVKC